MRSIARRCSTRRSSRKTQLLIDRLFPQVRLSSVSSSLIRDTRDEPLGPSRGTLVGIDTELAARAIGSEVGFVKSFVQGFAYRRLPGPSRDRLRDRRPARARRGVRARRPAGRCGGQTRCSDQTVQPVMVPVDDLPASERFFAGGDTTVRGFGLDQLGTPETLDPNGFPKGGNAVVVLNAELRVPVWRDVGVVTFLDGGNVFRRVEDFDVGEIRGAAGFGLRYRSPIGPLRLDLGFKLDRQRAAERPARSGRRRCSSAWGRHSDDSLAPAPSPPHSRAACSPRRRHRGVPTTCSTASSRPSKGG